MQRPAHSFDTLSLQPGIEVVWSVHVTPSPLHTAPLAPKRLRFLGLILKYHQSFDSGISTAMDVTGCPGRYHIPIRE
jgi:hypothetical protein